MRDAVDRESAVQGFGWIMLRSHDHEALASFYQSKLKLPVLRSWPGGTMFWAGQFTVLETGPLAENAPDQRIADAERAEMLPIFTVSSVSEALPDQPDQTIETENGFLHCIQDQDGNWLGFLKAPPDLNLRQPQIPDVGPLPQSPFALNRVLLRSEPPTVQRDFYQNLFGSQHTGSDSAVCIGGNSFIDFSQGTVSTFTPEDRNQVQRSFIPRVYGHAAFKRKVEALSAPLVNEMKFKGGKLSYHLDPCNQLFGFQERKPFDSQNEATHCAEDQVAREAFEEGLAISA